MDILKGNSTFKHRGHLFATLGGDSRLFDVNSMAQIARAFNGRVPAIRVIRLEALCE